ncbi:glycosyltransferase family 4 protein [Kosmotoga pacifica]|uniref:Glycosyl transferase n=1 Tax=Kosmotoga pacifica TaxID=1330330 RepID=A0A0G2Z7C5_9BACT|nr:MraY family glycosyltransferase [Kosmotoga pacifica]AKI97442.1 hypothetical protein IX53_05995 [Kosmotoga pacifica]
MTYVYSFIISMVLMYISIKLGITFNLLDKPKGVLKPHEKPIPFTGGLGIFLSILGIALFFDRELVKYLPVLSLLWFLGFSDDVKGLPPLLRLVAELAIGFLFSFWYSGYSFMLSIFLAFAFAVMINAFNMVDGMDGVCGGVSLVIAFALSLLPGLEIFRWIILVVGAFLVFNIAPAKVFLGDEGSYLLGGIFGIALIKSFGTGEGWNVLGILWLPLLDLVVGFFRRLLNGKSPFEGDRDHFYDKLKKLYMKNTRAIMLTSMALASLYAFPSLLLGKVFLIIYILLLSTIQITVLRSFEIT